MSADPDATQPTLPPQRMPTPGPTPTGYQRTQGGGVKWQPPSAEHLSKLLPQYEIEALIGHGGMGAVYKGRQKSLDRTVAIKILPPEVDDEDASYTERFKNEAKVMAKFMHPGIVGVFDFGETSEGQLYIVMEFVDGTDVQKMIATQGKLPAEHALAITAHVCDALKYAHEHGVIHRDIKPANILINMEGAVKVADFGLAKAEEHGSGGLTKSGMAMGTPDYVAPEALTLGVQVDGRADLYAVGVMLYQMLTGKLPRGSFDLPSKLAATDPRFDAIVLKAMKNDRQDRYQTSTEIRRDLDVILTMPLVQSGGQGSSAIPKQSLPQKPVARGPQKAGAPAPDQKAEIGKQKSKAPLFIGLGVAAAVAVGAFVMIGGRADGPPSAVAAGRADGPLSAVPASQTALGGPSAPPSAPPKKVESPAAAEKRGASSSAAGSVSATPLSSAPTPAKSTTTPPASTAPNPKAVSPTPPGVSASALQNAAAKPASASPSLPVSKSSSPQFPPGQWVKLFTKAEDLPAELRKPDSGVKFEDGWIRMAGTNRKTLLIPKELGSHCAVRVRIMR